MTSPSVYPTLPEVPVSLLNKTRPELSGQPITLVMNGSWITGVLKRMEAEGEELLFTIDVTDAGTKPGEDAA